MCCALVVLVVAAIVAGRGASGVDDDAVVPDDGEHVSNKTECIRECFITPTIWRSYVEDVAGFLDPLLLSPLFERARAEVLSL